MNSAMAWPLQQHRGPEEDLGRGIGPGLPGGYPSNAPQLFGPSTTPSTSPYYGRPLPIGGQNSRASQHMLTIEGVDDAAGDGGGGPFTQCVEPQPQRPASERFGRVVSSQAPENGGSENDNGGASEISVSGPGTSAGNGCFMPDSVLNMIGSSPGYSPPHIEGQQHHHHQQHHPQNFSKRDSHNPGQGRSSVAGMWPPSHGHFDDWGALLDRSTPPMPTPHSQQMTSSGFSSPHWSSTHTIAEKQTWPSQPHFQPYDRPPSSHQQQHQHPEEQHRRDGQSDTMHDQHLKHDATLQSYGNNGYLSQQQQQPPRHLVNGWSSPRTGLPRPLSPPNTSALEVSTLRSPAPVALAAANAVGLEDPEGAYSVHEDSASGVGGGGDVDGGMKPGIRSLSGAPAGGERATKLARTMSDKKVEERGNDGSGDGGGVKADGTGGGGAAKISAPRKRSGEDSLRDLTPEERLRLNRERNRDHSRRSRERKKAYVEGLKKQVSELGAYRMLVEEAHDLISAHSTDVNAVFTFASGGFDRLLGMDPSELLGVSFLELVDPNDSQEVLRSVLATLRRGGIRQVQYRMRPPAGAHAAEVETSFRLVSTRLVAVTRVRGRSPSACDTLPPPPAALPSLAITSAPGSSHVPPPSPLLVQPLPPVSGMRVDGGAGGLSLPAEFSGDW